MPISYPFNPDTIMPVVLVHTSLVSLHLFFNCIIVSIRVTTTIAWAKNNASR